MRRSRRLLLLLAAEGIALSLGCIAPTNLPAQGKDAENLVQAAAMYQALLDAGEQHAEACAGAFPELAPRIAQAVQKWHREDAIAIRVTRYGNSIVERDRADYRELREKMHRQFIDQFNSGPLERKDLSCRTLLRDLENNGWRQWRRQSPKMYGYLESADIKSN